MTVCRPSLHSFCNRAAPPSVGRVLGRVAVCLATALAAASPWQATAQPSQIVEGMAPVGPGNAERRAGGVFDVTLRPDPAQARSPVLHRTVEGPEAEFLRARHRRGFAVGMAGILYDNRDRGHSSPRLNRLPQLAATQYAQAFRAEGLDYGVAGPFRFPMPTIGNSSTAITGGLFQRSQARVVVAGQAAAMRAFELYASIGGLAATALDGTLRRVTHVPVRDGRGVPRLRDDLQNGP